MGKNCLSSDSLTHAHTPLNPSHFSQNSNGNASYGKEIKFDPNNEYLRFGLAIKNVVEVQIPACLASGGKLIGTGGGGAGAGFGGFGVISPNNDGVGTGYGIQFGINTDIHAVEPQTDVRRKAETSGGKSTLDGGTGGNLFSASLS